MAEINEIPDDPGYVTIKQAAQMLGITDKRVYRYIDLGRLPAYKSGGVFLLAEEDVRQFKLNPPGRTRTTPPPWRVYHTRSKVFVTEFRVPVRAGEQERLVEKLSDIQKANRHAFPGTIARYVVKEGLESASLLFFLVWKDTETPDDPTRERGFKALRDELLDVLEGERAEYHTGEALLYT